MRFAIWLCALTAAVPVFAQYDALATTADGSELLFVTRMGLRGTEPSVDPKLYRLKATTTPELVLTRSCDPIRLTGLCGITDLQVTGDGSAEVFQSRIPCFGGSSCILRELGSATLVRRDGTQTRYSGRLGISRNGRFLVNHDTSGAPGTFDKFRRIYDLSDGSVADLTANSWFYAVAVSSDGTVLTSEGELVRPGSRRALPLPQGFSASGMDDEIWYVVLAKEDAFRVLEVGTGRVFEPCPSDTACDMATLSGDGQVLLFRMQVGSQRQLFASKPDGSDWRQLTSWEDGAARAALSGDGRTVWAARGSGALVRLDSRGGVATEILSASRSITGARLSNSPGSLQVIEGRALAPVEAVASTFPLPQELGGVRVLLNGVAMRLLSVSPSRIVFQIPWELPLAERAWVGVEPDHAVFDTSIVTSSVRAVEPRPLAVVHQNFSGVIGPESPARPGEVVHVFGTGLGPVTPEIASGISAPLDRLHRTSSPLRFKWLGEETAVEVLFSGLAPGMVGVYQVDVRVPGADRTIHDLYLNDFSFASIPVVR